jgi:hypothetical protein
MVFATRTYLDSLNRYIVLRYYKALLGISERSMVSTEPLLGYHLNSCTTKQGYFKLKAIPSPDLRRKIAV